MPEITIIGAGLTGLSAGYHAEQKNIKYQIFEKENCVGGLCRTIHKDGFYFDFSGHLLHLKSPYCKALVKKILGDNLGVIKRNAAIYSKGVFTPYPFQANLYGLPPQVVQECLSEFKKAYYKEKNLQPQPYKTFRAWVLANFGKGIARHFMFPYNEKFWTVSTDEITCDWMGDYVPLPTPKEVFNGALHRQTKEFGYNVKFCYPQKGGIQSLCDGLAKRIKNIHLNKRVKKISLQEKKLTFNSGKTIKFAKLISTIPLKELIGIIEDKLPSPITQAARKLKHNSVLVLNIGVKGQNLTDKHWVYLPEKKYTPYRIGTYTNFSKHLAPPGTTSYYAEISYRKEHNINKEKLINRTINDMLTIGFIRKEKDILTQNIFDIKYAYVTYDRNHASSRKLLLDFLHSHNIFSIGRYGRWEYSSMGEAIEWGWQINRLGYF
jgi:UDP-galactopyranose mutase